MTDSINSVLSDYTTVGQQMTEMKNKSISTVLSGSSTSIADITETICSAQSDLCSISAISKALAGVVTAAQESEVSEEVIDNVRAFAAQLQEEGYSILDMVEYLGKAKDLAESDPEQFTEIFSQTVSDGTGSITDVFDSSSE